ncbi:Protein orai-2 [Halotydeus destructor]|nr:Protein orai-2 [Halotydeus destructor]
MQLTEASEAWRRLQLTRAKLKTSTKNSALLSGFAMVAMVELSLQDDEKNPIPLSLLILFGVTTTLLVAVHLTALMISSCILPHIEAIANSDERDIESINDSPHDRLRVFVEFSWIASNVVGIILFLTEIGVLCWVKFWEQGSPNGDPGKKTALAATIVLGVAILFFLFYAVYFYRILSEHNLERSMARIRNLERNFNARVPRKSFFTRRFTAWRAKSIVTF